jgi:acetolactate synthase-1/2/3 large subunit
MPSEISVAEYFARFLAERNVQAVFELSGGMIAFLTDAIYRLGITKIINTRHEQAAGFAAEAASRVTGIPNVAMGTSGPGATNLITAIGSAYFDSTPTIFVTGQVHTSEIRRNPLQRQNGFQELDLISATKALTKYAVQVHNPESFPKILAEAWSIATTGRPGPVLIDIPIDVQQKMCVIPSRIELSSKQIHTPSDGNYGLMRELIKNAKSPLILAGGGIRTSGTVSEFVNFVERTGIPVVHTLMGKDLMPTSHELNLGFIGSYGNRWANRALSRSDVLIVLGSRLDVRQTGSDLVDFTKDKSIIRVDVDMLEIEGRVAAQINFPIELEFFFKDVRNFDLVNVNGRHSVAIANVDRVKFTSASEQEVSLPLSPDICMKWISSHSQNVAGYCVDVGQHQMWAAQSISIREGQRFLTSGGMGAMGFSVPAAIGAAIASNERWFTITGDGCMQLTLPELQTVLHYTLPITIFIFNNQQHGMVAQFQDENMDGRHISTRIGYSSPDFCALGNAYGITSLKVETLLDFEAVEETIRRNPYLPLIVEIMIDDQAKALPKLDRFTKLSDL